MPLRLRNGESTEHDWNLLLTRSVSLFTSSNLKQSHVNLAFGNETVARYNFEQLKCGKYPIVTNNSHCKRSTSHAYTEFMGTKRLCNGSMGIIQHLIYSENNSPPNLPIAVLVKFPKYTGPSFSEQFPHCVPVVPLMAQCDGGN